MYQAALKTEVVARLAGKRLMSGTPERCPLFCWDTASPFFVELPLPGTGTLFMSLTGRNGKPEGGINQVVPRLPAVGLDRSLHHRNRARQDRGVALGREPLTSRGICNVLTTDKLLA